MSKKFEHLTIGADPELFLQNPNDGGFISAHGIIPGTKDKPFLVDKGAVQLDGTAVEFNIWPAVTVDQFTGNIRAVLNQIQAGWVDGSGYRLVVEPVADFDPVYFDQHVPMLSKRLGCDPDYNAWSMEPNEAPDQTRPFRTGAGHIHIGWGYNFDPWSSSHFEQCAEVSRQLDYYLGMYSLLWDSDNRRRELYGQAGAFRPKPYGVEYRVLSNAWLRSEPLQRWVFYSATEAMRALDRGHRAEDLFGDKAQSVINGNLVNWLEDSGRPYIDSVPLPPGVKKAS